MEMGSGVCERCHPFRLRHRLVGDTSDRERLERAVRPRVVACRVLPLTPLLWTCSDTSVCPECQLMSARRCSGESYGSFPVPIASLCQLIHPQGHHLRFSPCPSILP